MRNLAMFNSVVIVMLVAYAYRLAMPLAEIIPMVLTAILASIPVALPATFTLAAALGARALAHLGVLPTRLSAVDEAATIDVLCVDKTGTLTRNELTVTALRPAPGFDEAGLLGLAAVASADGGQDPVDAAIRAAALSKGAKLPKLIKFIPFDPAKKTSEATAVGPKRRHHADHQGCLCRRDRPCASVAGVGRGRRTNWRRRASGCSRLRPVPPQRCVWRD